MSGEVPREVPVALEPRANGMPRARCAWCFQLRDVAGCGPSEVDVTECGRFRAGFVRAPVLVVLQTLARRLHQGRPHALPTALKRAALELDVQLASRRRRLQLEARIRELLVGALPIAFTLGLVGGYLAGLWRAS